MKLAIFSQRLHFDYEKLCALLAQVKSPIELLITCGRASECGTVECYAIAHGIPVQLHYPPPEGMSEERSARIVAAADNVMAFWDFNHTGIREALALATEAGKKTYVVKI